MRLGFYVKWTKDSLSAKGNVVGDELLAESFCRALRKFDDVEEVSSYAPNAPIKRPLDAVIYLNDNPPCRKWGKKHILYLQSGYEFPDTIEKFLQRFYEHNYDGYIFFAKPLLDAHEKNGREGIYLPFGVDTAAFSPRDESDKYKCEVSYVGNDIKGTERTMRYLYPALAFDFALYGNWEIPRHRFRFWKNRNLDRGLPPYKKAFRDRSRGRIPQEDVPVLYSSSRINLNCTLQSCAEWDVITLRAYEVLACKGFLITDKIPSAESILKGKAVFTDGGDDLVEKIRYYLAHGEERRAVAERGYKHVIEYGSITSRAETLIKYLRRIGV
jgi:spore maturation protein CgeB